MSIETRTLRDALAAIRRILPVIDESDPRTGEAWLAFGLVEKELGFGPYAALRATDVPSDGLGTYRRAGGFDADLAAVLQVVAPENPIPTEEEWDDAWDAYPRLFATLGSAVE